MTSLQRAHGTSPSAIFLEAAEVAGAAQWRAWWAAEIWAAKAAWTAAKAGEGCREANMLVSSSGPDAGTAAPGCKILLSADRQSARGFARAGQTSTACATSPGPVPQRRQIELPEVWRLTRSPPRLRQPLRRRHQAAAEEGEMRQLWTSARQGISEQHR